MDFSEGRFDQVARFLNKWPWLLIVILLLAVFSRLGLEREANTLNFVFTHYLFNYGEEFVKRGLVGEVLRWLPWSVDRELIQLVSIVLTGAACLALSGFFVRFYCICKGRSALLMVLLVGLSPATLLHFMFDVGRFDAVLYGLLPFVLLRFALEKNRSLFVDTVMVLLFTLLVLLVHEAAFFMLLPLLLGCWHLSDHSPAAKKMQCFSAVFAVCATFFVSTEGAYTLLSHDEHLELLRLQYGRWVNSTSLIVLHGTGLLENMYIAAWSFSLLKHYWEYACFVVLLLPLFFVLFGLIKSISPGLNKNHLWVLVAATTPLLLCFLGADNFRWFSLVITNFFLALLFFFIKDPSLWREAQCYVAHNQCLMYVTIVSGWILGPVGVNRGFEVVERVLSAVS